VLNPTSSPRAARACRRPRLGRAPVQPRARSPQAKRRASTSSKARRRKPSRSMRLVLITTTRRPRRDSAWAPHTKQPRHGAMRGKIQPSGRRLIEHRHADRRAGRQQPGQQRFAGPSAIGAVCGLKAASLCAVTHGSPWPSWDRRPARRCQIRIGGGLALFEQLPFSSLASHEYRGGEEVGGHLSDLACICICICISLAAIFCQSSLALRAASIISLATAYCSHTLPNSRVQ